MCSIYRGTAVRILVIVVTSVVATYAIMVILQLDGFLKTILRGHYWRYHEFFIPTFIWLVSGGLFAFRGVVGTFSKFLIAMSGSYIASLTAFYFLPARIPTSELLSLRGINWMFFISPFMCFSWLYGVGVILIWRMFSRRGLVIAP